MPKVDFYTITKPSEEDRLLFACRLTEKAFTLGHQVYIHLAGENMAEEMDNLLWTFNEESYVPHAIVGIEEALDDEDIPVLIGYQNSFDGPKDVLINLSPTLPDFHGEFQRITEVVNSDDRVKAFSREHWKAYKAAGYTLEHHEL